jgi:phosphoglucosamine mutase
MTTSQPSLRLFGTDGIRAPFGTFPLDEQTVSRIGYHLGQMLREETPDPLVILGGDTRRSTEPLCDWIAAGLRHAGALACFGGTLPTPAIAFLVRQRGAAAGVAVSASHNLLPDNGIKLFDHLGFKWQEPAEEALEARLFSHPDQVEIPSPTKLEVDASLAEEYRNALEQPSALEHLSFDGMTFVIDAANGAASPFAAKVFRDLGAEVVSLHDRPDGNNINLECGSTHPEAMASAVVEAGADLGIAFDGDADRALFADEKGVVRDGDAALYLWACHLNRSGLLEPPKIVATSMSNLGLERALEGASIELVRCGVGDRTVVNTMLEAGISLGGEQSGHIVDLRHSTTGDGLATALQVASIVAKEGRLLSELLASFVRFPQVLINVKVRSKPPLESLPSVAAVAHEVAVQLGNRGRLVLRYSGTEPLARVMIEGEDQNEIDELASNLIEAIRQEIGAD